MRRQFIVPRVGEPPGHDTRLAYSRDVARASVERDKCLRALGLDGSGESDVLTLLETARAMPVDEPQGTPEEITEGEAGPTKVPESNRHESGG